MEPKETMMDIRMAGIDGRCVRNPSAQPRGTPDIQRHTLQHSTLRSELSRVSLHTQHYLALRQRYPILVGLIGLALR
jgi:hypothetical protein